MKHIMDLIKKPGGQFTAWRLLNIIISGILLAVLIFFIFFIYQNVNTALINTAIALDIKSKTTFDTLNIKKYDAAKQIIEKKKQLPVLDKNVRNMFNYETVTTTTE